MEREKTKEEACKEKMRQRTDGNSRSRSTKAKSRRNGETDYGGYMGNARQAPNKARPRTNQGPKRTARGYRVNGNEAGGGKRETGERKGNTGLRGELAKQCNIEEAVDVQLKQRQKQE